MQASKKQIKELVIDQLHVHYRSRWNPETNAREFGILTDEFIDAIYARQIEVPTLKSVMSLFKGEWKYQRWPTLAELLDYMPEPDRASPMLKVITSPTEWADSMLRSDLGRRALDAGVGVSVEAWCIQHPGEQLPPGFIETEAAFEDRIANKINNLSADYLSGTIKSLWAARQGKEQRLREKYR
jgi:hypothetical protein